jgi:hypothetical protein
MKQAFKRGDKVRIKKLSEPLRSTVSATVTEIINWQGTELITIRLYNGRNIGETTISSSELELMEA